MKKETVNLFNKGLNYDLNPLTTPNDVLTDCVNGTFVTFNGDELILQNDAGNTKILKSKDSPGDPDEYVALSPGFHPIGVKEYGGILYIISTNGTNIEFGSYPSPEYISYTDESGNFITINNDNLNENIVLHESAFNPGKEVSFITQLDSSDLNYISKYDSDTNKWVRKVYKLGLYQQLENSFKDLTIEYSKKNNGWWFYPNKPFKNDFIYKGKLITRLELEPIEKLKIMSNVFTVESNNNFDYKLTINLDYNSGCDILINGYTVTYEIDGKSFNNISTNDEPITITLENAAEYEGKIITYKIIPTFNYDNLGESYTNKYTLFGQIIIPNIYETVILEPTSGTSSLLDYSKVNYEYLDTLLNPTIVYQEVLLKDVNGNYLNSELNPTTLNKFGFKLKNNTIGLKSIISEQNTLGTYEIIGDNIISTINPEYEKLDKIKEILKDLTLEINNVSSEFLITVEYPYPMPLRYNDSDELSGASAKIIYLKNNLKNLFEIPQDLNLFPQIKNNAAIVIGGDPNTLDYIDGDLIYKGYSEGYKKFKTNSWESHNEVFSKTFYKVPFGEIKLPISKNTIILENITKNTTIKVGIIPEITYDNNYIYLNAPGISTISNDVIYCKINFTGIEYVYDPVFGNYNPFPLSLTDKLCYFKYFSDKKKIVLYNDKNEVVVSKKLYEDLWSTYYEIENFLITEFLNTTSPVGFNNIPDGNYYKQLFNGLVVQTPIYINLNYGKVYIKSITNITLNSVDVVLEKNLTDSVKTRLFIMSESVFHSNYVEGQTSLFSLSAGTEEFTQTIQLLSPNTFNPNTKYYILGTIAGKNEVDDDYLNLNITTQLNILSFYSSPVNSASISIEIKELSGTSIIVKSTSVNTGGGSILNKGILYSTNGVNWLEPIPASPNTGSDNFEITIPNLNPNTPYWIKGFVENELGKVYSNVIPTQTTGSVPSMGISITNDITDGNLPIEIKLNEDWDQSLSEFGYWISEYSDDIQYGNRKPVSGSLTEITSVNYTITGLSAGKTYYIRSYAENNIGIGYSNEIIKPYIGTPKILLSDIRITGTNLISVVIMVNFSADSNSTVKLYASNQRIDPSIDNPILTLSNTDFTNSYDPVYDKTCTKEIDVTDLTQSEINFKATVINSKGSNSYDVDNISYIQPVLPPYLIKAYNTLTYVGYNSYNGFTLLSSYYESVEYPKYPESCTLSITAVNSNGEDVQISPITILSENWLLITEKLPRVYNIPTNDSIWGNNNTNYDRIKSVGLVINPPRDPHINYILSNQISPFEHKDVIIDYSGRDFNGYPFIRLSLIGMTNSEIMPGIFTWYKISTDSNYTALSYLTWTIINENKILLTVEIENNNDLDIRMEVTDINDNKYILIERIASNQ